MIDLKSYLSRINFEKAVDISLDSLSALQEAHLLSVAFENLDIHYGKEIFLDIEAIFQKVVIKRRGGFCYELNGLFYALLKEIGFEVKMVSGRVYAGDGNYGREYDHLAIIAEIEGREYLVDVGFGKFALKPLEIKLGTPLTDDLGIFEFDEFDDKYLRINEAAGAKLIPQYIFRPKAREFSEFEEMCLFHQKSDESHFTKKKVISIATSDGRITLNDTQLKTTKGDSENTLNFPEEEFEFHLKEQFDIEIN